MTFYINFKVGLYRNRSLDLNRQRASLSPTGKDKEPMKGAICTYISLTFNCNCQSIYIMSILNVSHSADMNFRYTSHRIVNWTGTKIDKFDDKVYKQLLTGFLHFENVVVVPLYNLSTAVNLAYYNQVFCKKRSSKM